MGLSLVVNKTRSMHCLEIACWTITVKCCFKLELSLSAPLLLFPFSLSSSSTCILYAELFCLLGHFLPSAMSHDDETSLSNFLLDQAVQIPCHHIIQFEMLAFMFKGTTRPTHAHTCTHTQHVLKTHTHDTACTCSARSSHRLLM